jgi:hemolysin III
MKWDYDRAEVIADGIIHALGVALGGAGVLSLLVDVVQVAATQSPARITAALTYGTGLLTVLCLSATYNLWPISPTNGSCAGSITPPSTP